MSMNHKLVAEQTLARVGQCVMTCPTTACFNGWDDGESIDVGKSLRYFGDGFQTSKLLFGKRFWRIPVMDGEFLCEEKFGSFEEGSDSNLILVWQRQRGHAPCGTSRGCGHRKSGGVFIAISGRHRPQRQQGRL